MWNFFKFERFLNWRRKYSKFVNLIAVLIVFITIYALILPALTLDQEKVEQSSGIDTQMSTSSTETSLPAESSNSVSSENGDSDNKVAPSDEDVQESQTIEDSESTIPNNETLALITESTTMIHKEEDYELTAEFDASAQFPQGVELQVRELDRKSEEYKVHYDKAKEALGTTSLSYARFFDISFIYEGNEVEPSAPVKIKIKNNNAVQLKDESKLKIVHFESEDNVEILEADTKEENKQVSEVTFEAKSFSVYGDIAADYYSVDFVYSDDTGVEHSITTLVDKTSGSKISSLPEPPFKNGFAFSHWQNRETQEKVDENTEIRGNMVIEAVFIPINIYTIDVIYFYHNASKNQDVIIDKERVQLETSDTPYQMVPPESTEVSSQEDTTLPADAIYYPEFSILEFTAESLKTLDLADGVEDRKISQSVEYVPHNAEYDVVYRLKNLDNSGYSDIQTVHTRGVLGSTVTPRILTYDYANYERSDTAKITQASGQKLYVYYTRKTFNLTYNSNGGSNVPQQSGLYDSPITVNPNSPTKEGYDFAGWYNNPQLSGNPVSTTINLKANTVLYAKWTPKTVNYTIVYYKQEYDNMTGVLKYVHDSSQSATGTVGTVINASSAPDILTNAKYWEKDTVENNNSSVEIEPDGSSVLKVYYKLKKYTFVFNLNYSNGIISINGKEYTGANYTIPDVVLGQDISNLWPSSSTEVFERSSRFSFNRWEESRAKTKRFEVTEDLLDLANTSNLITQTASWVRSQPIAYVEYWLQSADDQNVYVKSDRYSQSFVHTVNLSAKEIFGYTYRNTTPTGYQGSVLGPDPYIYRFYYNRTNYKIDYYFNGNLIRTTDQTVPFERNINNLTYNYTPSRPSTVDADYTWGGWYVDAGLTTPYSFSIMPRSNLVLYANWIAPKFNVTFDTNGASSTTPETQVVEKYKYARVPEAPTKEHHNFLGWYTEDDQLFSWSDRITSDIKLTAKWEMKPLSYTVQYLEVGSNTKLAEDKEIASPALALGQSITEQSLGITGYRPNSSSQTIQLDYANNRITFYYTPRSNEVTYTVKYVLKDNPAVEVAPALIYKVDGSIIRAKEAAASVDKQHMATQSGVTPDMLGTDYRPTENTKGLILTSNSENNVITFEYVPYDTKIFTVNYLDMDGDKISGQEPLVVYQKKPGTFVLDRKAIDGYTFDNSKDSENATNKILYRVDSGGQISIDLYYKKNLTISAADKSKIYDRKELKSLGVDDLENAYLAHLKKGDSLTDVGFSGSQTNAGLSPTIPKDAIITNALGANRTNFYKIIYEEGTLTVEQQPVVVLIDGDKKTKVYDGQEASIGYTITEISDSSNLFDESNIQFNGVDEDKKLSVIDAGDYTLNLQGRFTNLDPNFKVNFQVSDGNLAIAKRQIILTSDSASKDYDGSELTADNITITVPAGVDYDGFVSGQGILTDLVGGLTEPGTMPNTFNYRSNGQTNLNNYEIEVKFGQLKVNEVINIQKTDLNWQALVGGKFEVSKWDGLNWAQISGAQDFAITSTEGSNIPVGLEPGRYRIQELAAPDGFVVLDSYIYFTIKENFNEDGSSSSYTVSLSDENGNDAESERAQLSLTTGNHSHRIKVANEQGKALPNTGGYGQKWFIISGLILMASSFLFHRFVKTRRKGGDC